MKDTKTLPGAREKLPIWFSAAWSSRSVALSLNMAMVAYSSLYFTDVLGLNPAIIGILLMVSKFFDAFTDLVIGYIVDRTKTKLGKARPYEIAIVFLWLFIFLMYATPEMGNIAIYAWVFVTYTLQSAVFITILYGTDSVYLIRSVRTEKNRTVVTAATGVYNMLFGIIVGMIIPQVMQNVGVDRRSWAMVALCLAIPCATIGMLRFFFIPELDVEANASEVNEDGTKEEHIAEEKLSLKKALRGLMDNKYLGMFALMYFCYHFSNGISGGAQTYYLKYIIGDLGVGTWLNAGMMIILPLLLFTPKIMGKLGTGKTLRLGLFLMLIGPAIRMIGGTNLATLIVGYILFIAGSVPIAFMLNIYLFECMDYGEWKTGVRIEGMMGSITSFMAKVASAVASSGMGIFMTLTGYVGTAQVLSDSAETGIKVLFNIVPMLIVLIALLISFRYDVGDKMPEIKAELEKRHN
ncbi:MFS transporter [Anaerobium acetethylicum]|uniref:Glycoside/pentoside/hexuronide:cation symporter, GPH family/probable glucitol transport protein GutA n=1 Tax=Anaerobium acetethylicum TaxID=1619234 RepID=A0A1D3TX12_9FIRM|nr:MFS transporter [Anaerobium acetethylicum]SCP98832.1 glycoside/pentoside/hexuronide:cation symporter, GPH family/probable glucitol transport protein GutA [Anaerobium acetethylicum]